MKSLKTSDTTTFQVRASKTSNAISISIMDVNNHPRFLTTLWGVRGTNVVADYCNALMDARNAMQVAQNIEQQYSR